LNIGFWGLSGPSLESMVRDILRFETQIDQRSTHSFQVDQKVYLKKSEKMVIQAKITNVFIDQKGQPRLIDQNVLGIWPDLAKADKIE